MVWRNLAFGAFYHKNDIDEAILYLERALSIDNNQAEWYGELADYYDLSEKDFARCLQILSDNIQTVKRDINAPKSLVKLYNLNGDYDKAIDLLREHHFRTWEGGRSIYYHYVDAHCLKALELMDAGKTEEAIQSLQRAMEYPDNLEVGKPLNDERNAMIYYYLGVAHERLGEKQKAREWYERCVTANNARNWPDLDYYQGLAYQKLDKEDKTLKKFNDLIQRGDSQLAQGKTGSGIGVEEQSNKANKSISEAYYLKALGSIGLQKDEEALEFFRASLKAYPNNLWAKYHLEEIQ